LPLKTKEVGILAFFHSLKKYILPHKWLAIILLIGILSESGFEAGLRFSFQFLIDVAIVPQDSAMLVKILVALGCGAIALIVISLLSDVLWAKLSGVVINKIRLELFEHVHRLSMEFFTRKLGGDLLNHFLTDMSAIENTLVNALYSGCLALSSILFSGSLLFSINWQLAVFSGIGVLLCIIAPRTLIDQATATGYIARQQEGRIADIIQESIQGQSVIRVFGLEQYRSRNLSKQLDDLLSKNVRANILNYISQRIPTLLFIVLNLITLGLVSFMTLEGWLTLGNLVSYQVLFLSLNSAIYNITWVIPNLIEGMVGMRRVEDILMEMPKVEDVEQAIDLPPLAQEIRFEKVSFSYAQDRLGLDNVSFSIRKGDFVAFVGPSGSGKSTVINLLMRFYDPTTGSILFDQVDLRQASQRSLRDQIGWVSQDVMLFNASIRENIRLGKLDATDDEVEAAALSAEIHNIVLNLPQGYDTLVGERGGQLSGGQRQRIALARALVRDPAILILDEATSALDPITEAGILATLEQVAKNRTVISITHRLALAIRADVIFVFRDGQFIESGNHTDLLQQKSLYTELWNTI
jgi:ATP-binding cassette, subfamily B, bacterial